MRGMEGWLSVANKLASRSKFCTIVCRMSGSGAAGRGAMAIGGCALRFVIARLTFINGTSWASAAPLQTSNQRTADARLIRIQIRVNHGALRFAQRGRVPAVVPDGRAGAVTEPARVGMHLVGVDPAGRVGLLLSAISLYRAQTH